MEGSMHVCVMLVSSHYIQPRALAPKCPVACQAVLPSFRIRHLALRLQIITHIARVVLEE